jgi:rhodanese-related sulfurtransferase
MREYNLTPICAKFLQDCMPFALHHRRIDNRCVQFAPNEYDAMNTFLPIAPQDLFKLLPQPKVLLVDVRDIVEVAHGRIPNALHIPLSMLPVEHEKLNQAQHVVFYCHSGVRSALAADYAISKGIQNVYNLTGGIVAWTNAGYTLVD